MASANFAWRLINSGDIHQQRKNDLSERHIIQLKGTFNHFDEDKDGMLSVHQLCEALQSLGFTTREKFLRKFSVASAQMKLNGAHSMNFKTDFKTFSSVVNKEIKSLQGLENELDALFAYVDVNETGYLSRKELRFLLVDVASSSRFNPQEFSRFVKGLTFTADTDSVSIVELKRQILFFS